MTSPYLSVADTLRDRGYHVLPCMPGSKVPGEWRGSAWEPMRQWSAYCEKMPVEFLHTKWQEWPDAGVCMAHGAVVGLDIDTDRQDVATAAVEAVGASPVRRKGAKGWMGYYRVGDAAQGHTARVRWYDKAGTICVELLLHGTQSVLPPTIHPGTGQPYRWLTPDSLEDYSDEELPELPADAVARLDAAFGKLGLTRQAPRKVNGAEYQRSSPTAHDLEKPLGRSLNDRAMEPAALDQWWPALDMPKSRQRGRSGSWEAVPFWRASNSGRPIMDRNPNLRVIPQGIVDFGADRSYTPIDVVMAARDCSFIAATEWLGQFVREEESADISGVMAMDVTTEPLAEKINFDPSRWAATPVFSGTRSRAAIKPVALPSDAEWDSFVPKEPHPFPLQSLAHCEGILGEVASHIDAASATMTDAGALAVTIPLLGAVMGRAYASDTNLRTNVYTVALGGSGTGKTSLVNPAKELMRMASLADLIGQDRIPSGSGLVQMLTVGPRRVCFLDEFGHMLQQIGSSGAGIHAKQIITEFTALYSAANSIFTGTAYASREPTPIDCPHLCLFGMATPEQFWRAFGSSALEDGSVARYLVFPLGQTAPKDMDTSAADSVAQAVRDLQRVIAGRINGNLGNTEVTVAPFNDYALAARDALKRKETAFAEYAELNAIRGGPAIMRRVTENATKIALISAVGRNPKEPEIDAKDFDIGHALSWWSATVMISNIASYIADNQTERDVNDVERFIVESGNRGRDWRDIQRKFRRIKTRDLKEIAEGLEREGSVTVETIQNKLGGHPAKVYRVSRSA